MQKKAIGGRITYAGVHTMPFSKAMRAGDLVFVSGQMALDDRGMLISGGIEQQTRRVLQLIQDILTEAGCSLSDVVKVTVWLSDTRDFWAFNRVYAEFFPDDPPARSTVRADLVIDAKVEIEAIAFKPV